MKKKISLPIIVEGKYDKNTLSQIFDCTVLATGGFSVFNSKEKQALLRRICADGAIVLTDSDGGGKQIRSFLNSILPKDKIHNLYIPKIEGKERRKSAPSKAGTLGVEGMSREVLERVLAPFALDCKMEKETEKSAKMITKVDFFEHKLTGFPNSSERRRELCRLAQLPDDMTPNALLEALNLLYGYGGFLELVSKISETDLQNT